MARYLFLPRTEWRFRDKLGTQHHFYQFPVAYGYALTAQIIQGATVAGKLFWDVCCPGPAFVSHGTTYVIAGRVEDESALVICGRERNRKTFPNVVEKSFVAGVPPERVPSGIASRATQHRQHDDASDGVDSDTSAEFDEKAWASMEYCQEEGQ